MFKISPTEILPATPEGERRRADEYNEYNNEQSQDTWSSQGIWAIWGPS